MSDLISREDTIADLHTAGIPDEWMAWTESFINAQPSVEPERKPGKWIWNKCTGEYECSECGRIPAYDRTTPDCSEIDKYRFCRWCGAPMEVDG